MVEIGFDGAKAFAFFCLDFENANGMGRSEKLGGAYLFSSIFQIQKFQLVFKKNLAKSQIWYFK